MRVSVRVPILLTIAAAAAALAAVACGGGGSSKTPTAVAPQATSAATKAAAAGAASTAARIKLVSPTAGASVTGDRLEVQVNITGLKLDGTKIGQPAAQNAGVGHWHVYVDGKYAGLSVSDVISLPNDAMSSISSGQHEIKVQLHNTDHTPLTPEATDTVTVTFP